jgi:hypothetical protein
MLRRDGSVTCSQRRRLQADIGRRCARLHSPGRASFSHSESESGHSGTSDLSVSDVSDLRCPPPSQVAAAASIVDLSSLYMSPDNKPEQDACIGRRTAAQSALQVSGRPVSEQDSAGSSQHSAVTRAAYTLNSSMVVHAFVDCGHDAAVESISDFSDARATPPCDRKLSHADCIGSSTAAHS